MQVVRSAALLAIFAASSVQASAADRLPPDRPPSMMTSREIAEFNTGLQVSDPVFITCRRIEITGSLVKKARVCRTNNEWRIVSDKGNQNVRDTIDAMSKGSTNNN